MPAVLVSGLINLETNVRVGGFPLDYAPIHYNFFGVHSAVSGVGFNVASALAALGTRVRLLSLIGDDPAGRLALAALADRGLSAEAVLPQLTETPQSAILFDSHGRRQIHLDLKNIQDKAYPSVTFERRLAECDLAVLCNIGFSRPWLARARALGKLVATDVHALSDPDDAYNRDFMAHANLLFLSHENLPLSPQAFASELRARYAPDVIVIGLGADGAWLSAPSAGLDAHFPAVRTRQVVNTIGAGDALFAAFVHFYAQSRHPQSALRRALFFASWKIGASGGASGFLDESSLNRLVQQAAAPG
jgi:acarbose 7IV-phosphotransferase